VARTISVVVAPPWREARRRCRFRRTGAVGPGLRRKRVGASVVPWPRALESRGWDGDGGRAIAAAEGMTVNQPVPRKGPYDRDYYRQAYGLDEMRRFSIHWWSARFYASLARRVLRRAGGRRLLEVGCGHGYTLARLEREFETVGIDLSAYAIGRAREITPRSALFEADLLGELPDEVGRGGFDLVLAKYVLEHLPDPERALERIAGLLAPGGRLLYSVPDTTSPSRRFRGDQWYALLDDTHVSLLGPPEWLRLTERAGFVVERSFADGVWDMPWFPRLPVLPQYALFCLPTIVTVALARPLLPVGWGENVIVLARKEAAGFRDRP